jgi:hypothetical protein
MNHMRRDPLERLTIRAALVLGFGLVLGLWLFTGYAFTTRLTDTERRTSEVTRRYLQAQDALSAIRLQLNVSSIALRDALLDPSPASEARHLKRLEESYTTINAALDAYQPVLDTRAEPVEMDAACRDRGVTGDPRIWRPTTPIARRRHRSCWGVDRRGDGGAVSTGSGR